MNALWLIGLLGLSASVSAAPLAPERSAIHSTLHDLPLTFEVNQGQTDVRVDFLARGQGYTIFLTPTEAVFALPRPSGTSAQLPNGKESSVSDATQPTRTAVRMQLVGSAPDPQAQGLDALPGKVNYFRGNDSARWRKNVRTYKRVRYASVYPGVDLVYYGQSRQLEYDFIVNPGADPSTIKLAFTSVDDATIDARGDLVLKTAGAPLRFQKPVMYQVDRGRRFAVEGGYVQVSPHEVAFRVGPYDRTQPLIIDPVLSYSTYLGGSSGEDDAAAIVVDPTGAAYVAGLTSSTDFPTVNALQPELNEEFEVDAFIAKLTPDGGALVYATYFGGPGRERVTDIALDVAGNAYITGVTASPDFPAVTVHALQATLAGPSDGFVAKLSADGSQLLYSTYLGGRCDDGVTAIAVDLTGAAYVTGITDSPDFPTMNPLLPRPGGVNAFVAKLAPDGTGLAYATYLGGSLEDFGRDIAVDSVGAAYVTGSTLSLDFPTVNPVPRSGVDGRGFVTKLASDGKSLIYSTYLGDGCCTVGSGIAADTSGAAYVTGNTVSADFPTVNALQPVYGGSGDAFVLKLPPEGGMFIYATYLGGSDEEPLGVRAGIAVDAAGAAHVTGTTRSLDFPTMNALQPTPGGTDLSGRVDAFVAKLAPDGMTLAHSTFLGGSDSDFGFAIAVDLTGAAYVTGLTTSDDFPTVRPLQASRGSTFGPNAFVAKITDDSLGAGAGNTGISGGQSGGSDGGGSLDALLAVLLAQLTLVRALRQRIRTGNLRRQLLSRSASKQ